MTVTATVPVSNVCPSVSSSHIMMDDATKARYLAAFFKALPGEACIKDLKGNCIYSNVSSPTTDEATTTDEEGFIEVPLKDEKGEVLGTGFLRLSSSSSSPQTEYSANQIGNSCEDDEMNSSSSGCSAISSSTTGKDRSGAGKRAKRAMEIDSVGGNQEDEVMAVEPKSQNYQRLFHKMPIGAALNEIVVDESGQPIDWIFREVNAAFEEFTGLKAGEIVGKRATECMPGIEDDPCNWIKDFGSVALTGETYQFSQKFDKTLKKWYGGMAYQPTGQERYFVALFQDESNRIKAEEDLRESEERHRNLFESMMQGVVYQEASGAIIAVNPSAERILGLTVDQMMGRTSVDPRWKSTREDGSDFPGDQHPSMLALKSGRPVTGVLMGVYHPITEKHHWIIIDSIPRFRPDETEPYQVYSTFTDMTQTKTFERRLLREKTRAEMADRLKSAFLANMSHEIRTPLNGIIGHIDLALSNELSQEKRAENLDGLLVARQSGELLITIIQDILDLSKIEAGQLDIEHDGHFKVRELIDQISSLGETMIKQREKNISFETLVQSDIHANVMGDVFRVQQVLNNLVSNAVKFTDTGKVSVSVALVEDDLLEYCVCDTGKGIPLEHQESIFEPFRQVEFGDTRKHGGTGLGLTISKKLVEMMGGTMSLESSSVEPTGTCFRFTVPYRSASSAIDKSVSSFPNEKVIPKRTAATTRVEGKVLVAEDDTVSRRMVQRMLNIAGYDVVLAENGLEALEKYQSSDDIALILMDVQMPKMDGLAATKKIREFEQNKSGKKYSVPIVALSAGAMKGDNERGFEVGMTDYLTKPVNFKLLKETLRIHLGDHDKEPASTSKG